MPVTGFLLLKSVIGTRALEELRHKRVVIKAGTSILTKPPEHRGLDLELMDDLVGQVCDLKTAGVESLLVTSGAIAAGREALGAGHDGLVRDIPTRQVMAAIGQSRLMHTYQQMFASHGFQVAQTLLTADDFSGRQSYLNVRNTLQGLLDLGVVPILNENDVVAVDEIGEVFGDNDRLSALVANLVDADLLVILTDIDGLYTADPNEDPEARLIPTVDRVDEAVKSLAGKNLNPWARGGRSTKLEARKRWMLSVISQRGEVVVDAGADLALREKNRSLLPAGITGVNGEFSRGDIVYITGHEGQRIACGIANYGSKEIARIRGAQSGDIEGTLGYQYGQEVVHRNNLVLL